MITIFQTLLPSNHRRKIVLFLSLVEIAAGRIARADTGNDNPTGVAGQFNGNITTGCSYDPYTGNAMRAVTDIVVAGTVGKYPLAFSRVSNSRFAGASGFGEAGAWRHSYAWELNAGEESLQYNFQPTEYPVAFPDGREVTFVHSFADTYFRAPAPGIRERFIPLDRTTMRAYLVLPDGGKVRFKATPYHWTDIEDAPPSTPPPELTYNKSTPDDIRPTLVTGGWGGGGGISRTWYGYTYQAEAIIDPNGLETVLTYDADGLRTIQEPGGKYIQIFYTSPSCCNWERIVDYVQASDVRTVKYYYTSTPIGSATNAWTHLDSVVYYPDPSVSSPPTALYTYQTPNVNSVNGLPLLSTAYDPMYAGPMKGISYEYATGTNADNSAVANGQIRSERSIDGVLVSNIAFFTYRRWETKGEGGLRDLHLDPPNVVAWTDYVNHSNVASQQFNSTTGYLDSSTDLNHHTTTFASDSLTGNITSITYPETPGDTPSGTPAGSIAFRYRATCAEDPNNCDPQNPYYLYSSRDEAGNTTVYLRDEHHRIRQINYPDNAQEQFQYNDLGQVIYHQLKTGGWESFEFDPNTHLLQAYRDPYHDPLGHSGKPTSAFQYNARGLVCKATDWRGGYSGDPNFTTEYEYNLRGQITLLRHPFDVANWPARYTIQRSYNTDGTLASITDERNHTTSYNYDGYKRLWWIAAPPADENDTLPRTTYFHYNRDGTNTLDYTHTDSLVRNFQTASGKTVKTFYNSNRKKMTEIAGTGDESAYTTYTYDNAGNLKTTKDPAGQSTGLYTEYFYDERNRPFAINDAISADRNAAGYTVNWTYDGGGRRKTETRANNQVITYDEFDAMNRLVQKSAQRDSGIVDTTVTHYDFDGSISTFQDGRGKTYNYGHDLMSRQTSILYPPDDSGVRRQESYHYDLANNMDTFTNREGAVQTFAYDNRNRETHYLWNSWPLYTMHERWMSYDEAGTVRNIHNGESAANSGDSIDRQYDWRNRLKSETQTPTSRPARTVAYTYDADSNRRTMTYPSGYSLSYDYSSRNQLITQSDAAGVLATYTYDLSGNRRTRTLRNGTVTSYTPDPMNRTKDVGHYRGGTLLGRFDYRYDTVSRVKSAKRDFSKGDYYEYYLDDQLKTAQYDAYNVDLDAPWGAANVTTLSYDANGNRTSQANTATPSNTYGVNDLNQYTAVNSATPDYDVSGNLFHFDGWTYGYNRQNQLTDAVNGSTALYFYHDGLNRHILRYIGDANGGEWIFSAWDGWDLLEEYDINGQVVHTYVHGPATDEMLLRFDPGAAANRIWYHQDAQGSTTHLTDDAGVLKERYKYPPTDSGKPVVFDGGGTPISNSVFGNRFLYTGREFFKEGGFYDYRNRTYLPVLGRFSQPDPSGFGGGDANLYRYCGGNPVNAVDPDGLYFYFTQSGSNIHLYLPMTYIGGSSAIIGRLNSGITNTWSGNFVGSYGQYNVTMTVYTPAPGSPTNIILLRPGAGISFTTANANGGVWYLTQSKGNIEGMAAHEVGHIMLLVFGGPGGNSTDRKDIMGDINGRVTDKDIYYIINLGRSSAESAGPVFHQPFPGGFTLFGQLQSRLTPPAWNLAGGIRSTPWPGLYNNGSGWLPVGGASYDVRWDPNSGTGNWQADQFTKYYLMDSGPQPGEGTHPVSWELR
jgi:RHS repeat-associated protein